MTNIIMKLLCTIVGIFTCLIMITGKPSLVLPILFSLCGIALILLKELMNCIKELFQGKDDIK